ncbi:hypothetical protein [Lewinella sp. LCG006]|uniref:hypothetical protein n=1 Tax=Lewinella sp. LCG006 TaxID=3231911 RepID=UPI003460BC50
MTYILIEIIRRYLRKTARKEDVFKHIKWQLFKRPENLSKVERQSLEQALISSDELRQMEDLPAILTLAKIVWKSQ